MNDDRSRDYALVQRCLANDSRAFNDLINRYKRQVFSLIYRLVQNHADAEDLAQDTFIKAYRNLSSYDPQYPFLTWLFKIAHNTSIDFLRANKTPPVTINDEENPMEVEDPSQSLEDKVASLSQKELVEKVLSSLPQPYREILVLRHQQELAYEEIARTLDIPVGTVKVRLFRARDLMKQKMQNMGYG